MTLELLDASKIKTDSKIKKATEIDKKDSIDEEKNVKDKKDGVKNKKDGGKDKGLRFLPKGDILSCERIENGITNNCVLCQNCNNEIFIRCPNKWRF